MGYIPCGSTNDYAASLGLPTVVRDAVRAIVEGSPQAVDMGAFNDDTFVYVAAFGAFTDVAYDTNQDMMRTLNLSSIPHVFVYDKYGKQVYSHTGYIPGDEEALLQKLLQAK